MLHECTHLTRQEIDVVSWEYELHLHFVSKLMPDDWYLIDSTTTEKVSHITAGNSSTCTRPSTYLSLPSDNRKPVTNLSNMLLEDSLLGPE
jgi:hypothetical protein